MAVNCTATPNNMECVLTDVGSGLGSFLTSIAVPMGTLLIVVAIAGAVGAIFYGIAKKIGQ